MESPPSFSGWSETPISISEDSGLPLTCGSVSSGSVSGERVICELPDSDGEDKSLSQYDSLDYSDSGGMCGEHFNTLKKGPHFVNSPIDPPPAFQDSPPLFENRIYDLPAEEENTTHKWTDSFNCSLLESRTKIINREICSKSVGIIRPVATFASASPARHRVLTTPVSVPRLYSSHNSLTAKNGDDSDFITQAMSHEALNGAIRDVYNVPCDSDIYTLPVDTVRPIARGTCSGDYTNEIVHIHTRQPKKQVDQKSVQRKRRRNTSACEQCRDFGRTCELSVKNMPDSTLNSKTYFNDKRHSVAGSSGSTTIAHVSQEPLHMTLEEVRNYLQTLYSSSSESSVNIRAYKKNSIKTSDNNNYTDNDKASKKNCKTFLLKSKKIKNASNGPDVTKDTPHADKNNENEIKKHKKLHFSLRETLCNIFRFRAKINSTPERALKKQKIRSLKTADCERMTECKKTSENLSKRALPPLPSGTLVVESEVHEGGSEDTSMDFTLSIEKVKDYGWYWGPISGEAAERILSNEPDGSFIVRDSSDHHYIFSLTFKLNGCVRHVRIEHDQGNFSFGSCARFKSRTIVEFIENAVEHSRSGRYLFFLHRRPALGPMRVQLLHPVSRFKQVQSLQHMCRFIILKVVRRDLISSLPLPRRVIDYLSSKQYYSELLPEIDQEQERVEDLSEQSLRTEEATIHPPQSAVVQIITNDNTRQEFELDSRYQFHVIEHNTDSDADTQPISSSRADTDTNTYSDGKEPYSSDSSNINEIEGIRRGSRFRLGLRNNRERRYVDRQNPDDSSS